MNWPPRWGSTATVPIGPGPPSSTRYKNWPAKDTVGYPEPGVVEHTTKLVEIDQLIVEEAVQSAVAEKAVDQGNDRGRILALPCRPLPGRSRPCPIRSPDCFGHAAPYAGRSTWKRPLPGSKGNWEFNWRPAQQEAIRQACQQKMLVITGGPGVGKTTLVRSILEIFAAKKLKCVLAAPTGRAAKRLAETTDQTAKTVHRLLEFDPATGDFKRNQQNSAHRRPVRSG